MTTRASSRALTIALVLDIGLLLLFAVMGRNAHHLALTPAGVVTTGWPFFASLAVGWLVLRAWRSPSRVLTGVGVWAITVGLGFLLRWLSGAGMAVAFLLVAAGMLALFFIGWRLLAAGLAMLNRQPRTD